MSDLISRKALLEFIEENYNPSWYNPTISYFKDIITNAPTIEQGEIAELKAHINGLREALEDIAKTNASTHGTTQMMLIHCIKVSNEALASTPAQSKADWWAKITTDFSDPNE